MVSVSRTSDSDSRACESSGCKYRTYLIYNLPAQQAIDDEYLISKRFNIRFVYLSKFETLTNEAYGAKLSEFLDHNKVDCCIIEYIHNSFFLKYIDKSVLRILDVHDIVDERSKGFKKYGYDNPSCKLPLDMEKKIFNIYDYILHICEPDYKILLDYVPKEKLIYVPYSPPIFRVFIIKINNAKLAIGVRTIFYQFNYSTF